jgi:hypothetical protein
MTRGAALAPDWATSAEQIAAGGDSVVAQLSRRADRPDGLPLRPGVRSWDDLPGTAHAASNLRECVECLTDCRIGNLPSADPGMAPASVGGNRPLPFAHGHPAW